MPILAFISGELGVVSLIFFFRIHGSMQRCSPAAGSVDLHTEMFE